jgi:hypothetical protein
MKTEQVDWIQAENEFPLWIANARIYPVNANTSLRKSLHMYFRQQYHEMLGADLRQVFELKPPSDLLSESIFYRSDSRVLHEQTKEYLLEETFLQKLPLPENNLKLLDGFSIMKRQRFLNFMKRNFQGYPG